MFKKSEKKTVLWVGSSLCMVSSLCQDKTKLSNGQVSELWFLMAITLQVGGIKNLINYDNYNKRKPSIKHSQISGVTLST